MFCALSWFSFRVEGVWLDEAQLSMFVSVVFGMKDVKMDSNRSTASLSERLAIIDCATCSLVEGCGSVHILVWKPLSCSSHAMSLHDGGFAD